MPPGQMLKMSKEEFDRLMETSPNIPEKIVAAFKTSFKHSEAFDKIVKPEICDVLVSTESYRNPWSNEENKEKNIIEMAKNKTLKEARQKHIDKTNKNLVKEFKKTFFNLNNREPMDSEIIDNLKDKIELSVLQSIINEQRNNEQISIVVSNGDDISPV
jgi:tryptophanyl-tRNA synthetase